MVQTGVPKITLIINTQFYIPDCNEAFFALLVMVWNKLLLAVCVETPIKTL